MSKLFIIVLMVVLLLMGGLSCYLFFYKPISGNPVAPSQYSDLIKVENLKPNQAIQSTFILTGQARGSWYFEASFPVKLVDLLGNTIVQTFATANPPASGDWMTENFVPFTAILNFDIATNTMPAVLVLHNDNPSGLPENDKKIEIPVVLQNPLITSEQRKIQLYYYNADLDKDASGNIFCSERGLVGVERQIPITQTPIQDAIKLLLKGELTSQEKAHGITTEYPLAGFSLQEASFKNGVLTLVFNDPNNKTIGGSCRVGILWSQIKATAKQFSEVKEVQFIPKELFQP